MIKTYTKAHMAFREQQHPSTHRSENGQPVNGPQVENCNSSASAHYLANVFGMCCIPIYLVCAVAQGQTHIASPARLHSGSNIVSDSHPFRSKKSTDPTVLEICLFENLTLKIQVQGHG